MVIAFIDAVETSIARYFKVSKTVCVHDQAFDFSVFRLNVAVIDSFTSNFNERIDNFLIPVDKQIVIPLIFLDVGFSKFTN